MLKKDRFDRENDILKMKADEKITHFPFTHGEFIDQKRVQNKEELQKLCIKHEQKLLSDIEERRSKIKQNKIDQGQREQMLIEAKMQN